MPFWWPTPPCCVGQLHCRKVQRVQARNRWFWTCGGGRQRAAKKLALLGPQTGNSASDQKNVKDRARPRQRVQ